MTPHDTHKEMADLTWEKCELPAEKNYVRVLIKRNEGDQVGVWFTAQPVLSGSDAVSVSFLRL